MFHLQRSKGNSTQQHFKQPRELLLVSSQISMFLVAQTPAGSSPSSKAQNFPLGQFSVPAFSASTLTIFTKTPVLLD